MSDNQIPIDEGFLVIIMEILVRKYGNLNTLVIEDFRRLLEGSPKRFSLTAGIYGNDLVLHVEAEGEERVTLADLEIEEWKENEGESTVH